MASALAVISNWTHLFICKAPISLSGKNIYITRFKSGL